MRTKIFHNPRCSKSRATLQLLENHNVELEIIEYLKTPPDAKELRELVSVLGLNAWDIVRTGEAEFKALNIDPDQTPDSELLQAIVDHPILLQRPIVVHGKRAAIGRPPESVLDILDDH